MPILARRVGVKRAHSKSEWSWVLDAVPCRAGGQALEQRDRPGGRVALCQGSWQLQRAVCSGLDEAGAWTACPGWAQRPPSSGAPGAASLSWALLSWAPPGMAWQSHAPQFSMHCLHQVPWRWVRLLTSTEQVAWLREPRTAMGVWRRESRIWGFKRVAARWSLVTS